MAKKPTASAASSAPDGALFPDDILTVHGGEDGLPLGMTLNGPMRARRLPDRRLYLIDLPPALLATLYPDIPVDETTPIADEATDLPAPEIADAPTIAEVN